MSWLAIDLSRQSDLFIQPVSTHFYNLSLI